MNQRDAWDIISSTFNDDILETLNQLVAIHLEDSNQIVVDVREFPINHLILVYHTPKTEIHGPTPVPIPAKKGESIYK